MELEFDPAKDTLNIAKHGISLRVGMLILSNQLGVILDARQDYGEARFNAFGHVKGRLYVCTYTRRGEVYRIIPVRKASRQEQKRWQS